MRRPSLGVQQNDDDDLSRLASSPVDNIAFSTAHNSNNSSGHLNSGSTSSSNSSSSSSSEGHQVPEEGSSVSYLPKIIELEWQQQQQQNHRKRKERLDSTSSNSQTDRKVIRSNEDQLHNESAPNEAEDPCQQPLLEEKPVAHISPLRSHQSHLKNNLNNNCSNNAKKANGVGNNGCIAAATNLSYAAWSNNVTGDDHYSDGEHERRRSSERFCRSRAPHGRKSSSCSSAKKSSSSSSSAAGGRYLNKALRQQNATEEHGGGYKYDLATMRTERRGFNSRDSQKQKKQKAEEVAAVEESDSAAQMQGQGEREDAPLPWNELPDETPVVCPRFAENTFDHVINVSDKFVNLSKKETGNSIKYVNNENMKTRDIMKKYSVQMGANNGGASWARNRNAADLKLMIITPDERMRQISGRLMKLKKRILVYEEDFERDFGHRPDKVDTMGDKAMKTIMTEMQKLKKERQALKSCELGVSAGLVTPITGLGSAGGTSMFGRGGVGLKEAAQETQQLSGDMKISKMQETITDIEMVLQERRKEDNRLEALDKMSTEQLNQEKTAVQKGLLYLEGMFGRPNSKEERDLARPLYDRYRQIKRMLNRNSSMISAPIELPTILEHEAMVFTSSANNTPSTDATPPDSDAAERLKLKMTVEEEREEIVTDDSSSLNDNLHQLSITELWHQLDLVRDEKKVLRRTIKEYELQFEAESGRKMLKGDRKAMEETYALYKQKKGRLRLLDALVKKHMAY